MKKRQKGGSMPEHLKIISTKKKNTENDYGVKYKWNKEVYVIIDKDTGAVYDDADGEGYKSYEAAESALIFLEQPRVKKKERHHLKKGVSKWCETHPTIVDKIYRALFEAAQSGKELSDEDILKLIPTEAQEEMSFSVHELMSNW